MRTGSDRLHCQRNETLGRYRISVSQQCTVTLLLEKSKTDKDGAGAEVMIVLGRHEDTCPVRALRCWLEVAGITAGPVFRKVNKAGRAESRRLSEDAVRQILLRRAAEARVKGSLSEPISRHGLRAGFVTTAYRNGVADEEIMGHTRHRSLTTMRSYVRRAKLKGSAPAGKVGL
jgi:integrase